MTPAAPSPGLPERITASGRFICNANGVPLGDIGEEFADDSHSRPCNDAPGLAAELVRRYNAHAALVEACEAIRKACADNAAPMIVEFALREVDRISLSSDLILDLLAALAQARGDK